MESPIAIKKQILRDFNQALKENDVERLEKLAQEPCVEKYVQSSTAMIEALKNKHQEAFLRVQELVQKQNQARNDIIKRMT